MITSDLILSGYYDAVLLLGDNQYQAGSAADYARYFDPTWGRFKDITYPAPGNHLTFDHIFSSTSATAWIRPSPRAITKAPGGPPELLPT